MYEIKKSGKFYVLDRNNKHTEFISYEELLKWLRRFKLHCFHLPNFFRKNGIGKIDRVGNNWNNICILPQRKGTGWKKYSFFTERHPR